MSRTFVYIDGFNLYYGAVRYSPYKWLDVNKLVQNYLKSALIIRTKYFTARVAARSADPSQTTRQQIYLQALQTIPNLDIIEGNFQTTKALLPSAEDPSKHHSVMKTEEKGSDVNLAVHMMYDAFKNNFDQAVLISNDSDLSEAVRLVTSLGKKVIVINPHNGKPTYKLKQYASFTKQIRLGALAAAQFPDPIITLNHTISRPTEWNQLSLPGSYFLENSKWTWEIRRLRFKITSKSKSSGPREIQKWVRSQLKNPKYDFDIKKYSHGRIKLTFSDWAPIVTLMQRDKA